MKTLESNTFRGCKKLSRVQLAEGLKGIQSDAFYGCKALKVLDLPNTLETIYSYGFRSTGLQSLILPPSVKSLGDWVFWDSNDLQSVTFLGKRPSISSNFIEGIPYYVTFYYPSGENGWDSLPRFLFGFDESSWIPTGNPALEPSDQDGPGEDAPGQDGNSKLVLNTTYDANQYTAGGGFYSGVSGLSDCVEILLQISANTADWRPVTITAKVSGSGMSFARDDYQPECTLQMDPTTGSLDLLMLYPYGDAYAGQEYTVSLSIASKDLSKPVEQELHFSVWDAQAQRLEAHRAFVQDPTYQTFKQNSYGSNMRQLKDTADYKWSRIVSLEVDNYYKVVWTDIMLEMLNYTEVDVSTVLKEYYEVSTGVCKALADVINQDYTAPFTVSEKDIDKLFSISKYATANTEEMRKNPLYRVLTDVLGSQKNTQIIQKAFAAVDKTTQVWGMISLGNELLSDFCKWQTTAACMNAYCQADQNLKEVLMLMADMISEEDELVRGAIESYLNYDRNFGGAAWEMFSSAGLMLVDMSWDTFTGVFGQNLASFGVSRIMNWLGSQTYINAAGQKAVISSAAWFQRAGAITLGATTGLMLSKALFNSQDRASDMAAIIAASEFSTYAVAVLDVYEQQMIDNLCPKTVAHFEQAFGIHRALQSTILAESRSLFQNMSKTVTALIPANNATYRDAAAKVLLQKIQIDSLDCCGRVLEAQPVQESRVLAVRCPVDVRLADMDGQELLWIKDDQVVVAAEGVEAMVCGSQKYILLPPDLDVRLVITAREKGTMECALLSFDETMTLKAVLSAKQIPLQSHQRFILMINDYREQNGEGLVLCEESETYPMVQERVNAKRADRWMLKALEAQEEEAEEALQLLRLWIGLAAIAFTGTVLILIFRRGRKKKSEKT